MRLTTNKKLSRTAGRLAELGRTQKQQNKHINDPSCEVWQLILYNPMLSYNKNFIIHQPFHLTG